MKLTRLFNIQRIELYIYLLLRLRSYILCLTTDKYPTKLFFVKGKKSVSRNEIRNRAMLISNSAVSLL